MTTAASCCEAAMPVTALDRLLSRVGTFLVEASVRRVRRRMEHLDEKSRIPSILDPDTPRHVRKNAPPPGIGR
jgi:hypothetical protein